VASELRQQLDTSNEEVGPQAYQLSWMHLLGPLAFTGAHSLCRLPYDDLWQILRRDEQVNQVKSLFVQFQSGREQLSKKLQSCYEEMSRIEAREREALQEVRLWKSEVQERQGMSMSAVHRILARFTGLY